MNKTLYLVGVGASHPKNVIDNAFLENLGIGSSADWIIEKIGIKERRTVLPLDYIMETKNADPSKALELVEMDPTQMAASSTLQALDRANIKTDRIGLVIVNSCTPTQTLPTEAQRLTKALKISCPAYDIFTACPAFSLHIDYINQLNKETLPDYILCVSTAMLTQRVDYNDRSASAIWGDGAAAWIISSKYPGKLQISESSYDADPLRCQAVTVDTFGFFNQDGRAVRDFSVRHTVRMLKRLQAEFDLNWKRDIFIGHQANATMLEQIINNRSIPPSNHWQNVVYFGNQAAAGAPAVLSENWDKINPGQFIAVAVLGAGLSWGTTVLKA